MGGKKPHRKRKHTKKKILVPAIPYIVIPEPKAQETETTKNETSKPNRPRTMIEKMFKVPKEDSLSDRQMVWLTAGVVVFTAWLVLQNREMIQTTKMGIDSSLQLTRDQLTTVQRELRADMSVKFWQGERIGNSSSFRLVIKSKNLGKTTAPKVDIIIKYAFSETEMDTLFESLKKSTPTDWWEYEAGEELTVTPADIKYPPEVMTKIQQSQKVQIYMMVCAAYIDAFGKLHHSIVGGRVDEGFVEVAFKWTHKD